MNKQGVSTVTNSNDFRRYSYSTDAAYALQAFEAQRRTAAPSRFEQPKKQLRVHENTGRKSVKELVEEQKRGFMHTLRIAVVMSVCIAMLCAVLYTYVQKNELNHELGDIKAEIEVAESESTRLNSELDALVSMSMIDQYAVEKLGMSKVQASQIRYIDVARYKETRAAALADQSPAATAVALEE